MPEVRELVDGVRAGDGASASSTASARRTTPRARTAVHGWLWFMDGACLDWIAHRDLSRAEMHGLLLGTLAGSADGGRRQLSDRLTCIS